MTIDCFGRLDRGLKYIMYMSCTAPGLGAAVMRFVQELLVVASNVTCIYPASGCGGRPAKPGDPRVHSVHCTLPLRGS